MYQCNIYILILIGVRLNMDCDDILICLKILILILNIQIEWKDVFWTILDGLWQNDDMKCINWNVCIWPKL